MRPGCAFTSLSRRYWPPGFPRKRASGRLPRSRTTCERMTNDSLLRCEQANVSLHFCNTPTEKQEHSNRCKDNRTWYDAGCRGCAWAESSPYLLCKPRPSDDVMHFSHLKQARSIRMVCERLPNIQGQHLHTTRPYMRKWQETVRTGLLASMEHYCIHSGHGH